LYIRLAVATPWGIELNQHIFVVVDDNILVGVGNDNSDRVVLLLRDRLRFDARRQFTINKVLNKGTNLLLGELCAFERILLVLAGLLNGKCWPLIEGKVEVAGMSAECLGVDSSEVDLALVLLGN